MLNVNPVKFLYNLQAHIIMFSDCLIFNIGKVKDLRRINS